MLKNFICMLLSFQLLVGNVQGILPMAIVQNKIEQKNIIENEVFHEKSSEDFKSLRKKLGEWKEGEQFEEKIKETKEGTGEETEELEEESSKELEESKEVEGETEELEESKVIEKGTEELEESKEIEEETEELEEPSKGLEESKEAEEETEKLEKEPSKELEESKEAEEETEELKESKEIEEETEELEKEPSKELEESKEVEEETEESKEIEESKGTTEKQPEEGKQSVEKRKEEISKEIEHLRKKLKESEEIDILEREHIIEASERNVKVSETDLASKELYKKKSGYFYIFIRKEGEKLVDGTWYKINMSVDSLSAQIPQKINWSIKYLKEQKGNITNINHWIWSNLQFLPTGSSGDIGIYSLKLDTGKVWETGQDGYGTEPIFGEWAQDLENLKNMGLPYPYPQRYYMLCGQFLFQMPGYRMYFDPSVFEKMDSMDIEEENAQIQKKNEKLKKGEKSWTGEGYFKFAIDTNNVGMTAAGASGEFHHSIYGFYLKPNKYTIKYDKNGGTGNMSSQRNVVYDKTVTLRKNTFTRTGYKFTGWKDEKGNFYDDSEEVLNLTTEHNGTATLYAQWEPNELLILYHANGGSVKSDYGLQDDMVIKNGVYVEKRITYDKTKKINLHNVGSLLKREGYHIDASNAWCIEKKDGTAISQEEIKVPKELLELLKDSSQAVILYANWKPNTLTVKYHANEGKAKSDYDLENSIITKNDSYVEKQIIYDETEKMNLHNVENLISREGYHIDAASAWCIEKKDGTAISQEEITVPKELLKLLKDKSQTVTLYANWKPNTLSVGYHANGGEITGTPNRDITSFVSNWNYDTQAKTPAKMSSFGLTRLGYKKQDGKEWNTKADGTGRAFDQTTAYQMTDYAPNLKTGNRNVTLYAQWEPNVYMVRLDCQLKNAKNMGTNAIYEKYETGWYTDEACTKVLRNKEINEKIEIPQKTGYQFKGYFTKKSDGIKMINAAGNLTKNGMAKYQISKNATWYAQYEYKIVCEDYADIPCDLSKIDLDVREDIGFSINYNKEIKKITIKTNQKGCTITLTGKAAGTKVGKFQSVVSGNSISGTSNTKNISLSMVPLEGAAYQMKITTKGKTICDKLIYFQEGRFRTLAKLDTKEEKIVKKGTNISGSDWGTENDYSMYQYAGCSELKNVVAPETVYRYFCYKDVAIAYSGNGATSGTNILETGVSLENIYQLQKNEFVREEIQTKQTTDKKTYTCKVKYGFVKWKLCADKFYQQQEQSEVIKIYENAVSGHIDLSRTLEPIETYKIAAPIVLVSEKSNLNLNNKIKINNDDLTNEDKINNNNLITKSNIINNKNSNKNIFEYINMCAMWNAFPTIVLIPEKELEFYEGEEVAKEDLTKMLIAHDEEDNSKENRPYKENLNNKIRIIEISYPKSKNSSQKSYKKTYKEDVPKDFLLDTYYLKLEPNETVKVQVTFAVTDSNGNTTKEVFPIKIKYNNYPEINSEDIFYYLKEEANRGEITKEALIKRATAKDIEDGKISNKLKLKDFNPEIIRMQTESKAEFKINYQVVDAYKKITYKTVKLVIWDEEATLSEIPQSYVRYISPKYLDTLEKNSIWREHDNYTYLMKILSNKIPLETWEFRHEDIVAVKEWITAEGKGNWKIGQEANKKFLSKFSFCKKSNTPH